VIETAPGPPGTRRLPTILPQNLAVPGQTVQDALTIRPELPLDTLEDLILGVPGLLIPELGIPPLSQLEMAFALQPTFTIFWLGPNDVLGAVLEADTSLITPIEVFMEAYPTAVGMIQATGSSLIVANIPDVLVVPFLASAAELAAMIGLPLPLVGSMLGIEEGDFVTGFGLELVFAILTGEIFGPLPENVVLTAAEAAEIQNAVAAMNSFIAQLSSVMGFPVVDVHAAFQELNQNGLEVGDLTLNTEFLGGLFSLDGVHPTNTGQAFIANLFIDKMNEFYDLEIEEVDLVAVAESDPMVGENLVQSSEAVSSLMVIGQTDFERMRASLCPVRDDNMLSDAASVSAENGRYLSRQSSRESPAAAVPPAFGIEPGPVFALPPVVVEQGERNRPERQRRR
jgi:hypothetical protein